MTTPDQEPGSAAPKSGGGKAIFILTVLLLLSILANVKLVMDGTEQRHQLQTARDEAKQYDAYFYKTIRVTATDAISGETIKHLNWTGVDGRRGNFSSTSLIYHADGTLFLSVHSDSPSEAVFQSPGYQEVKVWIDKQTPNELVLELTPHPN